MAIRSRQFIVNLACKNYTKSVRFIQQKQPKYTKKKKKKNADPNEKPLFEVY